MPANLTFACEWCEADPGLEGALVFCPECARTQTEDMARALALLEQLYQCGRGGLLLRREVSAFLRDMGRQQP